MKMLLAGLAIVAATVGAGLGYAAMQTSALPDWYSQPNQSASAIASANSSAGAPETSVTDGIAAASSGGTTDGTTTVIPASRLNQMVTDAIASQPYTAPILDAAKGVNTSITDGRIESGAVINLADLPLASLPAEGQHAVEQLTRNFPFLADRDVYLGVEGTPKVVNGAISLDDTHVKLGQLSLPMAKVASQLGLSQSDIEHQIDALLSQQGVSPSDVEVIDGQLVIKGQ